MVAESAACPQETFARVAELLAENSGPGPDQALCYAVGWTQHTIGVQIHPRRGDPADCCSATSAGPAAASWPCAATPRIQGSTDIPTLYNLLPGYLPHAARPTAATRPRRLRRRREHRPPATGSNFPSSSSACSRPGTATPPRPRTTSATTSCRGSTGDHSHMPTVAGMADGKMQGLLPDGPEPGGRRAERPAAAARRWRSSTGWWCATCSRPRPPPSGRTARRSRPASCSPRTSGPRSSSCPAAAHAEKDGSFTNTQRLLQWHDKAVDPPGDARCDLWFTYHLGQRIRAKLAGSTDPRTGRSWT